MDLTVRSLDNSAFKKFRAKAAEEGMKLGEALTQAMELWIKQRNMKRHASLLDIKPFNWGNGTERINTEIDQTLYGEQA
jgi:hypothetical protein